MKFKNQGKHKAFTIMELMISIVVIGILATLSFKGYDKVMSSANAQKALDQLAQVKAGLARYYRDTGTYPTDLTYLLGNNGKDVCYDAVSLAGNFSEDINIVGNITGPYVEGMVAATGTHATCLKAKVGTTICLGATITDETAIATPTMETPPDCSGLGTSKGFDGATNTYYNVLSISGIEDNVAVEMYKQENGKEVSANLVSVSDGNTTDRLGIGNSKNYKSTKTMIYRFRDLF